MTWAASRWLKWSASGVNTSSAKLYRVQRPTLQGHIVVEVCDMDNEALVRMVGGSAVETVVSHDIIGRLMIQCARQPGLATVWEQLMGFDGGCSHEGLQGQSRSLMRNTI